LKPTPTYGDLVNRAARRLKSAGIDGARLDARLIVGTVAGLDAAALLSRSRDPVSADVAERTGQLVARRENREPLAHILGNREFWSLSFGVTPHTLIPRPDSETLIDAALQWAAERDRPLRVLDLGCGTGCLLISLLTEWPQATGFGVDIDEAALAVAKENACNLGCGDRAQFACADWGDGLDGTYDVVISNPPYVRESDLAGLEPEVSRFEPRLALCGGIDGLDAYRALAQRIGAFLAPGGAIFLEIGIGQGPEVARIMAETGFDLIEEKHDLAGIVRCLAMGRRAPIDC
jgi:release factor glutamine methyltransferase